MIAVVEERARRSVAERDGFDPVPGRLCASGREVRLAVVAAEIGAELITDVGPGALVFRHAVDDAHEAGGGAEGAGPAAVFGRNLRSARLFDVMDKQDGAIGCARNARKGLGDGVDRPVVVLGDRCVEMNGSTIRTS